MLRTIEQHNGFVIQKITKADGSLVRYQVCPQAFLGDSRVVQAHATLEAARKAAGAVIAMLGQYPFEKQTAPKSAYAQNQKGYRADRR